MQSFVLVEASEEEFGCHRVDRCVTIKWTRRITPTSALDFILIVIQIDDKQIELLCC